MPASKQSVSHSPHLHLSEGQGVVYSSPVQPVYPHSSHVAVVLAVQVGTKAVVVPPGPVKADCTAVSVPVVVPVLGAEGETAMEAQGIT